MIADPLHLLECCLRCDVEGAVIVASPQVAGGTKHKPVRLLSSSEKPSYPRNGRDITDSAAARSGPPAFAEAGVCSDEIDIAMIYDSFTIPVMGLLEDLGFRKKDAFAAWAAGGRLRWDNPTKPAVNTGGGLSSNHPVAAVSSARTTSPARLCTRRTEP
jgi:acetyl-CoA C-acetyltransferase